MCAELASPLKALVPSGATSRYQAGSKDRSFFFFFITLGLELSDTKVYEP
jgi:hypothetical protein